MNNYKTKRRNTINFYLGNVGVGSNFSVSVQSMINKPLNNLSACLKQTEELVNAGCEILRIAVPNKEALKVVKVIKKKFNIPLVADIHFDYKLALYSVDAGIDGLRLNPGNIKNKKGVREVVRLAKEKNIPIRIGVNAGSLSKEILRKYKYPTAPAMVESALQEIKILKEENFQNIKISLKASDVLTTVTAYKILAKKTNYPLHLGITEAGILLSGSIKSALGIGILLYEGIGDTLRVSLTDNPLEEIKVAKKILSFLSLRNEDYILISCPTCSRCEYNFIPLVKQIEKELQKIKFKRQLKIAVMGCEVNGPGEAKFCDIGLALGKTAGIIFKEGKVLKKIKPENYVKEFVKEVKSYGGN